MVHEQHISKANIVEFLQFKPAVTNEAAFTKEVERSFSQQQLETMNNCQHVQSHLCKGI